ncbi:aspartyl-phosphate phosphatase Spo0E family protein [Paenibacillus sp.]|uniref:aspartyl-phosphate phosphatase Spo0E family protein n=1 Tax=Paenibacillus sp. TaxID=58172 RepID=UPI0039C8D1E1
MNIPEQIKTLKKELLKEAEKHNLNLQHPAVLKLSCDLDELIVLHMKSHPL